MHLNVPAHYNMGGHSGMLTYKRHLLLLYIDATGAPLWQEGTCDFTLT